MRDTSDYQHGKEIYFTEKRFISEMTRLLDSWTNDSNIQNIALKALMLMSSLLLQKTSTKTK